MTKMLSASGGLRTRHGASQPVTPSAAYASEAEPPLLHITTLTTVYISEKACCQRVVFLNGLWDDGEKEVA